MSTKSKKIIGIDLGSTNSCVSVLEGGEYKIIPNSEGRRTTPSIVAFMKDAERKVGDPAKRQAVTNPENTIYTIKRLMGKSYEEVKDLVLPYNVVDNGGRAGVKINDKVYSPEEISAMILQKMKKTAEEYLGMEVESAVITVPAYFNDAERTATKNAGEIAGLKVERIINEPTAAALAYGSDKKMQDKKIAVFDCGGSTHDVSILEVGDGVFDVLATDGDVYLGGDDIDKYLIDHLAEDFLSEFGVDLRKDPMAHQRLREAGEKAKIELSSSTETEVNLPYIMPIDGVPKHLVKKITRAEFDKMIDSFIQRTIEPCKTALKSAGLTIDDIDEVLLVGGTTRIPAIQEAVEKVFGKTPSKGINPDEAVSAGACIQGGVLSGDVQDVLLLDVTPISLGIETMGGVFTKMIEANTTIPTKKSETYSTASDNQPSVQINVLQGERPMCKDNKALGEFNVDGIPPSPRGIPQIEVTFNIDANSILTVTAKDKATGKENHITIKNSNSLSEEEIATMKADAEANADSDAKEKETADKLNEAESTIFQTEKSLTEYGDKIKPETKETVEKVLVTLKEAKESKDVSAITTALTELQTSMSSFYTEMEEAKKAEEGAEPVNEDSKPEDVEFEEVVNESSETTEK